MRMMKTMTTSKDRMMKYLSAIFALVILTCIFLFIEAFYEDINKRMYLLNDEIKELKEHKKLDHTDIYQRLCNLKERTRNIEEDIEELKYKPKKYTKEEQLTWFRTRYPSSDNIPNSYFKARGKALQKEELEEVIRTTLEYLIHSDADENIVQLLLETAKVESDYGRIVRNKRSSAIGIFQILPSTARCTNKFLNYYKDLKTNITKLYDDKHSLEWNLIHNLPYAIAISYTVYWRKIVELDERSITLQDRAELWKKYYNTYLDRLGTVSMYISKNS